ncbi:MAG: hypothetical protein C0390_03840 [Syntrophus sp. (in: bacteria)]|nr:hypothetical protein [Syntrophus sp. (in: bacteria)]
MNEAGVVRVSFMPFPDATKETDMDKMQLEKKELKELLTKCWMTHDAMWFYHCLQECGIEKTNKVNRAAVKALATVEITRLKKAAGVERLETFGEFWDFFQFTMATLTGDFMKYSFESKEMNHICGIWHQCFAYEGVKMLGMIDQYECGIMDRVESWFDTLGIKYEVEPKVTRCMMHTEGRCYRDYTFFFGR